MASSSVKQTSLPYASLMPAAHARCDLRRERQ